MGNKKGLKVNDVFIDILKQHFELDTKRIPVELRKKNWQTRFAYFINHFIHNELVKFDTDLYQQVYHKSNETWPSPITIKRAFLTKEKAVQELINVCGWYIFKEKWTVERIRFQVKEDKLVEYDISVIFQNYYIKEELFNRIRIVGDKDGVLGQLAMNNYYVHLSYIEHKDLSNRNTLLKKEQENLSRRFKQKSYDRLHLGTDYLSSDVIENNQRIIITGNPGVGKSTYARWLCHQWAQQQLSILQIPIYIQLRDLNFSVIENNAILRYIRRNYLKALSLEEIELLFINQHQQYLLILDGYDELNRQKQVQLEQAVKQLTQPTNQARYIVLSRPYGLLHHRFDKDIVLQIDGFTISSIENYIRAFLEQQATLNKTKEELLKYIKEQHILMEYAHNPLMLSYIVLIYIRETEPQKYLEQIKSIYDLQSYVYNWLTNYTQGHEQVIKVSSDWQLQAGKLAYEMLMAQEFSYRSDANLYAINRKKVLELSQLGLGTIIDDESGWQFSFATVTLQEFLASNYIIGQITPKAFVYLLDDQYHWNFAKMLLGRLARRAKSYTIIQTIFQLLEHKYQSHPTSFVRYVYYSLLSETNPIFLNHHLQQVHIKELLKFYETSYFDFTWHPIVQEAFQRIYYKVDPYKKKIVHQLLTSMLQLLQQPAYQATGGKATSLTLFDIVKFTKVATYVPFIQNMIQILEELGLEMKQLTTQMESYEGELYTEEHYAFMKPLDKRSFELDNMIFIILQFLNKPPKAQLLDYQLRLFNFRENCPIDAWLDLEAILVKFQTKEEVIIELEANIKAAKSLPETKSFDTLQDMMEHAIDLEELEGEVLKEDIDELLQDEEGKLLLSEDGLFGEVDEDDLELFEIDEIIEGGYFPSELIYLSGTIFKAGILVKQQQDIILKSLAIRGAKLYLEKIFNPNFRLDNPTHQTTETIIQGLVAFNAPDTYDLIFDFFYKIGNDMIIDLPNDKAFQTYVTAKFKKLKTQFKKLAFNQLCKALENTWNSRYGFIRYRNQLKTLFFSIIQKNKAYFKKQQPKEVHFESDYESELFLQAILNIPHFTYDRKFFIDSIMDYKHQYPFLRYYAIPYLFDMDFPFYQEKYWTYLYELEENTPLPKNLLLLLTDDGIYHYAANLKHLSRVIYKINQFIKTLSQVIGNDEEELDFNHVFLVIISNTLKLMKESGQDYLNEELLDCTGTILSMPSMKVVLQKEDYLKNYAASDMAAYILQYYYTREEQYIIQFDYEQFKSINPDTHQDLLTGLIELLTKTEIGFSLEAIHVIRPVLGETFYHDILNYINDFKVLYSSIEQSTFEEYLTPIR